MGYRVYLVLEQHFDGESTTTRVVVASLSRTTALEEQARMEEEQVRRDSAVKQIREVFLQYGFKNPAPHWSHTPSFKGYLALYDEYMRRWYGEYERIMKEHGLEPAPFDPINYNEIGGRGFSDEATDYYFEEMDLT